MQAGCPGLRGPEEEGSGKQLSGSDPRVRTPVILGEQGLQDGLPLLLCDLGQTPASLWASVYPSLKGHWLPSSPGPYPTDMVLDPTGKGVPRQALSPHNPTYNLPPRAGATAEAAFLATTTPPPPPGLLRPLSYSMTFLLQPLQVSKAKLKSTGTCQGQRPTTCRSLSHPTSLWTLMMPPGSRVHT